MPITRPLRRRFIFISLKLRNRGTVCGLIYQKLVKMLERIMYPNIDFSKVPCTWGMATKVKV